MYMAAARIWRKIPEKRLFFGELGKTRHRKVRFAGGGDVRRPPAGQGKRAGEV